MSSRSNARDSEGRIGSTLEDFVERLRHCAEETPDQASLRWPYNQKVTIDSSEARALLRDLEPILEARKG